MHIMIKRILIAGAGALAIAGCQDLTVPNDNTPSVEQVFSNGGDLEGAVGTVFRVFWGVTQGDRSGNETTPVALAGIGEELTSADIGTVNLHEVIQEPRVPYNNYGAGQWINRKPWYDLLEVTATTTDALKALDNGVRVGAPTATRPNGLRTDRARIFAKMMQGLAHIYTGMLFNQGYTRDETMDIAFEDYEFKPGKEVVAFGIAKLEEAIAIATTSSVDTLPTTWINGQALTTKDLIKVMNSYIARAMVYSARNPADRAAVNWAKVLTHVDAGVTAPFGQQADNSIIGTRSIYVQRTQLSTNARVDNHIVGPSDTSGAYQAWLALPLSARTDFQVRTTDRRIHGAAGPATNGKIIGYLATQTMTSTRGTYMWSRYRGVRYGTLYYNTGFIQTMTPLEMDFIRAEAKYRLGDRAAAVVILNKTRTQNNLPAVTLTGPPPGTGCVPRKENGACGNLFDALMYEKRIELYGLEAIIPFADYRGWGRVLQGSMIEFPVHGRELQALGLPVYSFGGDLPGSAPAPVGPFPNGGGG